MKHDERAILAAVNNADLYEAMFQAWRLSYERHAFAFVSLDEPPPYHSHLTVLTPEQSSLVATHLRNLGSGKSAQISFKDSFCDVNPYVTGFATLFEAFWMWRSPEANLPEPGWKLIKEEIELTKWEVARKRAGSPAAARMFRPTMLQSPTVTFLGKKKDGVLVAGCVANLSADCVGISNVFSLGPGNSVFAEATAAVAGISHDRPIVGYCAKNLFAAAEEAGFTRPGALKVMISGRQR